MLEPVLALMTSSQWDALTAVLKWRKAQVQDLLSDPECSADRTMYLRGVVRAYQELLDGSLRGRVEAERPSEENAKSPLDSRGVPGDPMALDSEGEAAHGG